MKSLFKYIVESNLNSSLRSFFYEFSSSHSSAKSLRFLTDKQDRKNVCELFETTDICKKTLYRASFSDIGQIPNCKVGDICYEPLLSTSEDSDFVDTTLCQWQANDSNYYNSGDLNFNYVKIIFMHGTKSVYIGDISKFPEQKEWVACGKFKVIKKENKTFEGSNEKFKVIEITCEQIFDESLIDIFDNLSRNIQKQQNDLQNKFPDDETVIKEILKVNKKTIAGPELNRLENKHIEITKEYLQQLLAKRIFNNVCTMLYNYKEIDYNRFYRICKENNIKILGNKKFGYPEIDFPKTITF